MKYFIVCVRDRALDCFGRPFPVPSLGVSIRAFTDMVSGGDGEMSKHPGDYDLYQLGVFDDVSGTFENLGAPLQLAIGKQVVVAKGGA